MLNQDWQTFASVPWTPVTDSQSSDSKIIGYHKTHVPFLPANQALSLQTLEIWIPGSESSKPSPSSLPTLPGNWLVLIHGGAWRDPFVDSLCFSLTASNILRRLAGTEQGANSESSSPPPPKIAGIASLSYRLSLYPDHPDDPSPPSDPKATPDPARQARHPDHISDVLTGLSFLQRLGGANGAYALAGHSCGATLAFQAVIDPARWGLTNPPVISKPTVVLGVNGIYDLAGFVANPPAGYEGLKEGYEEFARAAFGEDEEVWKGACPASIDPSWMGEWTEGRRVVLAASRGDTLVPGEQWRGMREYLERGEGVEVSEVEITGGHDAIWYRGEELAEVCLGVMGGLV